ncbi:hypothetical protein RFI_14206 [Reticulomyxa filosa]|uniref:PDZ domain-containing protein n=1 Tax=Reticulomyxa filosa TaxID=46433 RepID=X6NAQ1_RETFI|nr:hypothetical protein RFI_14206 [Reticulomyxa filosa]|eukprot:ETO22978.1 hypothetical protein RFI_14206 [Reticulomyxa filosa]
MQREHPLWEKDGDDKAKLWLKYDDLWTLEYGGEDLYIAYSELFFFFFLSTKKKLSTHRKLPPSSGWEAVDKGEYPAPGVILHRIEQQVVEKDIDREAKDDVYIPIEFFSCQFDVTAQLGFTLKVQDNVVVVENVGEGQGKNADLQPGDILSAIDGQDVTLMASVKQVTDFLKTKIQEHRDSGISFIFFYPNLSFLKKKKQLYTTNNDK